MFLKNVLSGLLQKPITVILCVLMLTPAMLLSLFASALIGVSTASVPSVHLTVATRSVDMTSADVYEMIDRIRQNSSVAKASDLRVTAKGYLAEWDPYIPSADPDLVSHANFCVFVVKLNKIIMTDRKTARVSQRYQHDYDLEITQVVEMNEVYRELSVGSSISMQLLTGTPEEDWATEGGTYLIWGKLQQHAADGGTMYQLIPSMSGYKKLVEQNGTHLMYAQNSGDLIPTISELNMSLTDFWMTEVGELWRNRILPISGITYWSTDVVGTDMLDSVRAFNLEETTVMAGETFTTAQYEAGEHVCLISEQLAEYNGLAVGDTILISLYWPFENIYDPTSGFFAESDYRIIGIYSNAQDYVNSSQGTHPNTVYVPLRSMGELEKRGTDVSFIIDAGQENAFEAEMNKLGYSGVFEYYSGPKSEDVLAQEALDAAREQLITDAADHAKMLQRFGAVLSAVAVFLLMWASKKEIGRFYRIETAERVLFLHVFLQTLLISTVATGLSAAIAAKIMPSAVSGVLYKLADPEFADQLAETFAEIPPMRTALLLGFAVILLFGVIVAVVATKRSYHYEYQEGSET